MKGVGSRQVKSTIIPVRGERPFVTGQPRTTRPCRTELLLGTKCTKYLKTYSAVEWNIALLCTPRYVGSQLDSTGESSIFRSIAGLTSRRKTGVWLTAAEAATALSHVSGSALWMHLLPDEVEGGGGGEGQARVGGGESTMSHNIR